MPLPHENLVAWQRADDLFIDVHLLTHQRFPGFERYELGSQLRRAAYSVPADIVEGIARGSGRDSIRFLKIARAPLSELGYGLHACTRLDYMNKDELADFEVRLRAVAGPLQGLIKKRRIQNGMVSATLALLVVS